MLEAQVVNPTVRYGIPTHQQLVPVWWLHQPLLCVYIGYTPPSGHDMMRLQLDGVGLGGKNHGSIPIDGSTAASYIEAMDYM